MAHRTVFNTVLQSSRRSLPLNSAATAASTSLSVASPISFTETNVDPPAAVSNPPTSSVINLDDAKELFSSVPTLKLLKSAANLYATAAEPVVDLGTWVMNSRLVTKEGLFRNLVLEAVKHTFYEHFCAGETPTEACRTAKNLTDVGLKGILAYAIEHATEMESCGRNFRGFLETIESTKTLPESTVSFVVLKITAICTMGLLKRVSDLLRWEYNNESYRLPWKLKTLPIFADSSPFYHTQSKPDPLTQHELDELYLTHERIRALCEKCSQYGVALMVDAEDTSVQPAIDYFTYAASIDHNRDDKPIVFGTMQTYLKDSKERLLRSCGEAERMGVPLGVKLVRGAYMSSERELAKSLGVESPIHNTLDDTHGSFNDCTSFMLRKAANGSGSVVLATHNVDSGNRAAAEARELGIGKDNDRLQFGQLYGMCDALSFGLRNAGFQVSKYMPFGPVGLVIPYLLRRAEENKGMLSTSSLDRLLLRKELMRRLRAAVV